ncbi:MAG: hypothetical protein HYZ37_10275 [Candidatus Solibacter usitatus]|nr:hypothetical protein [Candidatus Solibacter usitatus]
MLADAQVTSAGVAAPTMGYVFDGQAKVLRPIEGVPGAAVTGGAMRLFIDTTSDSLAAAAIDPARRYAIVLREGAGAMNVANLNGSVGAAQPVELPSGDVYFSPSGDAVAIVAAGKVSVYTGLPLRAALLQVGTTEDLTNVKKILVSDDGGGLVALAGDGLYVLSTEGPALLAAGYRDAAFRPRSHDLLALVEERLDVFSKLSSDPVPFAKFAPRAARAFALSADERTVAILNADDTVTILDRDNNLESSINVADAEAAGIRRSFGNAVFQLRDLWFVDAGGATPNVFRAQEGGVE